MQHEFTIPAASTAHVPLTTPMLPELLSKAGYATHAIGKCSVGFLTRALTYRSCFIDPRQVTETVAHRDLASAGPNLVKKKRDQTKTGPSAALFTHRRPLPDSCCHRPTDIRLLGPLNSPTSSKTPQNTHPQGHLGYAAEDFTPTGRGFDTHFGYYQGEVDYYNKTTAIYDTGKYFGSGFDFWFNKDVWKVAAGEYSLTQFTRRGAEIFTEFNAMRNKEGDESKRLFLYLAEQTVHVPLAMARAATADR